MFSITNFDLHNTIIGFRNYCQLKLPSLAGIYVQQGQRPTQTERDYTTRRDFYVFKSEKKNGNGRNFEKYADKIA